MEKVVRHTLILLMLAAGACSVDPDVTVRRSALASCTQDSDCDDRVRCTADICNLIKQYVESSAKYQSRQNQNQGHDFCSNACEKLNDIVTAPNANAKAGKVSAFENMIHAAVNAEWLTNDQANTVIALARTL